jgi:hypothetical protein
MRQPRYERDRFDEPRYERDRLGPPRYERDHAARPRYEDDWEAEREGRRATVERVYRLPDGRRVTVTRSYRDLPPRDEYEPRVYRRPFGGLFRLGSRNIFE